MAIEGISAGMANQSVVAVSTSAAVSSQGQSTEASARVTEVKRVDRERPSRDGEAFTGRKIEGWEQESGATDSEALKKQVSDLNRRLNTTECQYGIHEETQRVTLKIVDKETKEVIKELPPEKTLEMIAKVWEMAGLLIDEKR